MKITVKTSISAPMEHIWNCFTMPEHITQWNFASPDWHCPRAINDIKKGGIFNWRMEAKDGSMGFDYMGTYNDIALHESIEMKLGDGRSVLVSFFQNDDHVIISEEFEAEDENSAEMQRAGWQAILENFKIHTEKTPL